MCSSDLSHGFHYPAAGSPPLGFNQESINPYKILFYVDSLQSPWRPAQGTEREEFIEFRRCKMSPGPQSPLNSEGSRSQNPEFRTMFHFLYSKIQNKSRQTISNTLSFRRWQLAAAGSLSPALLINFAWMLQMVGGHRPATVFCR